MSEYQYYEFVALDQPLGKKEMAALRAVSSRARITSTRFVNDYQWGDFKGDLAAWMAKYFDAHLYLNNWGTHTLFLRLPTARLDHKAVHPYLVRDAVTAKTNGSHVILSFTSDREPGDYGDFDEEYGDGERDYGEGDDDCDGAGRLATLIPIRRELADGDPRALYLGWLMAAQDGLLDDDTIEPPVPSGLGALSGALESLASYLRIGSDLIAIAAETSPAIDRSRVDQASVRQWLSHLPPSEKDK